MNEKQNVDSFLENHFEHQQKDLEYKTFVSENDLSNYDKIFVDFYRNGIIMVNNNQYRVKDLYIESGKKNNQKVNLLIFYKEPNYDILTGENKENFKRESVIPFGNSYCFYEIYTLNKNFIENNMFVINNENKNTIMKKIMDFDGTIHVETPETSFARIKY